MTSNYHAEVALKAALPDERYGQLDWTGLRAAVAAFLSVRVPADSVDDLVQDVTSRVVRRFGNQMLDVVESPVGYAVKVAKHTVIDHYGARSRSAEVPVGSSTDLNRLARTPLFQQPSLAHEQRTDLMEVVAKTAPDMIEAMAHFLQGYTITEIAEITGQPRERIYDAFREVALRLDGNTRPTAPALGTTEEDEDNTIVSVFKSLGRRQAEVLRLSAEGRKPREIAELLGITPNAARASKSISLKTIRAHVGAVETEEILAEVRMIAWRTEAQLAS